MKLCRLTPQQWYFFAEDAQKVSFQARRDAHLDRIDYALLAIHTDTEKVAGFLTCREHDAETVYWQFGGAMPGTLGTVGTYRAYQMGVAYARERYKRITTLIENTNTPMLRLAMKAGFRIVGTQTRAGVILVSHCLEMNP